MLSSLLSLNFRRKRLLKRLFQGPAHDFYAVPFPPPGSDCRETDFVALDLETSGLDPDKNEILSIGLVTISHMQINLGTASHHLVKPTAAIPEQSVAIHHITDDRAAEGEALDKVLLKLMPEIAGKVLIAHHARFELQFLQRAFMRCFNAPFFHPVIDTQAVAKRTFERRNRTYRAEELRLAAIREHYHLPPYRLHNALSDALAAAELFLAQLMQYDMHKPVALRNFLLKV